MKFNLYKAKHIIPLIEVYWEGDGMKMNHDNHEFHINAA